jgi:L-ascorbate metabolism protein UlaG (beta-lactamase superfamily)
MKIKWLGHACFLIEGEKGRLVTDPYNEAIPYRPPDCIADVITVSHDHFDHNAVGRVKGNPTVVRGEGAHSASGIRFQGILSFHDESGGTKRGGNTIFTFEMEGLKLAHLGDLGDTLTEEQTAALSDVEVVFIPVGGHYTIGADEAAALIKRLPNLKVVIPMHFKTDRLGDDFPIAPVDDFARKVQNVKTIGSSEVALSRQSLPTQQEVWILDYA